MRNIIFYLLFVLLSGCASFVETKISAFHELEQPLSGMTYSLVPYKEQESSLEFQSYAKIVQYELEKRGLTEAPFNQAKYAVFMFYGINDGKQVVSSYPILGQTGTSNSYTTGTVT